MSDFDKFKVLDSKDSTTKEYWDQLGNSLVESSKALLKSETSDEISTKNKDLVAQKKVQTSSLEALQSKTGTQCLRIKTDATKPSEGFTGTEETQENVVRFKKKPPQ